MGSLLARVLRPRATEIELKQSEAKSVPSQRKQTYRKLKEDDDLPAETKLAAFEAAALVQSARIEELEKKIESQKKVVTQFDELLTYIETYKEVVRETCGNAEEIQQLTKQRLKQ